MYNILNGKKSNPKQNCKQKWSLILNANLKLDKYPCIALLYNKKFKIAVVSIQNNTSNLRHE